MKMDVISLIFESFWLIRKHFREVAVPLAALLLLSAAGYVGGSSLSNDFGGSSLQWDDVRSIPRALSSAEGLMAELAGTKLLAISIAAAVAFAMAVLSMAIWYYASEHFYAILHKEKITRNWQLRTKHHLSKSVVMALLDVAMTAAFAASVVGCLIVVQTSWVASAILFLLVLIVWLNAGFYLIPVWVYYVLDNLPFFESISRSIALVRCNVVHFTIFAIIFVLLNIGAMIGSLLTCCFAFLAMPVLMVFLTFLWRVTLMKIKMAAEKKG
ncbi:MAG: hypothetical protein WC717_02350 [Candidatus Micrarchaeia archaeon]|jgi:hypothetical protein